MSTLWKSDLFLGTDNTKYLIGQFYRRHIGSGGRFKPEDFQVLVPNLMKSWNRLSKLDSYESLIHGDWSTELEAINNDFIRDNQTAWDAGSEATTIIATNTMMPEDYRLLDIANTKNIDIDNTRLRYNNTIPLYQWTVNTRNYETQGELLQDSLEATPQAYNMDDVLQVANLDYKAVDYLDSRYYGSIPDVDDDDSTKLLDTNWK